MLETLLIVLFFFVCYVIYGKWKDSHSEEIQASKQAKLLERELKNAKETANLYGCGQYYVAYQPLLRNDLKAFIFSSDYGDLHKTDIANPDNHPSHNILLAIQFYYLSNMPPIVQAHNLDKNTVIKEFQKCELSNNGWSPQFARERVLKKLKIEVNL